MAKPQLPGIGTGNNPRSIAALVPGRLKQGYDPRRHVGAPSLGRRITTYMNELGLEDDDGNAVYTEADLRAIIKDPKSAHAKVVAARELLRARSDGYDRLGRVPKAANSIDRICDRTAGKPKVVMEIEHTQRSAASIREELVALSNQHPELLAKPAISIAILVEARKSQEFRDAIRPLLASHHPALLESLDEAAAVGGAVTSEGEDGTDANPGAC